MPKSSNATKKKTFMPKRNQRREIVFDPEARKDYLRGFSERKRNRRAFGLAMQKIKDRKEKIGQRAEDKKDEEEKLSKAEKQKEELLEEAMRNSGVLKEKGEESSDGDSSDDESDGEKEEEAKASILNMKTYDDRKTEQQWGGRVTVITSEVALDDDESDDDDESSVAKEVKTSVDLRQKYAGNVRKYIDELKGKMPSKKKDKQHTKRQGKNGAAEMRGMGGAANLKTAVKVLAKTQAGTKGANAPRSKKGKKSRR
jgi:ribosomal RNA-processing protein 17